MIKFKSLNGRLLFAFAGLSIIVCLFFIRLSSVLIDIAEKNAYQSVLSLEVASFMANIAQSTSDGKPLNTQQINNPASTNMASPAIQVFDDLTVVSDDIKSAIQGNHSGDVYTTKGQHYLYETTFTDSGKERLFLMNISSLRANRHLAGFKSLVLYSISGSVMLLCLLSSWYLAKWLSTPIRKLKADIEKRTQNSNGSLFGTDREDEIGMLASALEQSYEKIQALLQREQNFTRDVSHELRTPITLIKNTIALNKEKQLGSDATNVVSQASQELEQTVEVLLALARQENLNFKQQAILPIVEKAVLNIYNSYPENVFNVSIEIDGKLQVLGNQYLISLLCQNLVNNGFYHSNSGGMTIYSELNKLVFENKIAGFEPRPYYQGLGHGQYLVKRIAQEMNWRLQVEQTESSYRVIITLI